MFDTAILNGSVACPQERRIQKGLNVYLHDGKIARVTKDLLNANELIDASGLIVSPGFIDPHTHIDGITAYSGLKRCATLSLLQGVTSVVSGNCGASRIDMDEFFAQMDHGFPVNHAELLGHGALRRHIGLMDIFKAAGNEQIHKMEELTKLALEKGAAGVSFGPGYTPGTSMQEIYALSKIVAEHGKIVAVDTYMDDNYDLENLKQMIQVSQELNVRMQISHFVYQYGQGVIEEALQLMDEARAQGIDVWADSGLYVDWASGVQSECFRESFVYADGFDIGSLLVATGEHTGKTMDDQLYRELRSTGSRESVICKTGWEGSVLPPFTRRYVMPSSDTAPYNEGEGHPQIAGSFAGFFRFVREERPMPLGEAVYRATLLPAEVFNLRGKGRMEEGADADIVLFDEDAILDMAAYPGAGRPDAPAIGVSRVMVAGKTAILDGKEIDLELGRAIRVPS